MRYNDKQKEKKLYEKKQRSRKLCILSCFFFSLCVCLIIIITSRNVVLCKNDARKHNNDNDNTQIVEKMSSMDGLRVQNGRHTRTHIGCRADPYVALAQSTVAIVVVMHSFFTTYLKLFSVFTPALNLFLTQSLYMRWLVAIQRFSSKLMMFSCRKYSSRFPH